MRAFVIAAISVVAVGCGDDDGVRAPTAVVRFAAPAAGPIDFADVPFPSDAYLDSGGHIEIGALPSRRSDDPMFRDFRDMLAPRGAFCSTCNAFFRVDGELELASVPPSAVPGDAAGPSDPIVLVDTDSVPPRFVPLRVQWDAGARLLSVRPVRGVVLTRGHRHALGVTSALRATDGTPLGASATFARLRDGMPAAGDPAAIRLATTTDAALAALAGAGVERTRLVAAVAFRVWDPTRDLASARVAVHSAPMPTVVIDRVYPGPDGTLDDLLGVAAEARPGVDVPQMAGTAGTRALVHDTVATIVLGRLRAARVLTGAFPDVGTPRWDADGNVVAGPAEDVPFVLAVPRGADLARLPVLFVHHGFNASRTTTLVLAEAAGRAGVAVFGVDAFQHGARAPVSRDELYNMRGDFAGADGFAENDLTSVSPRVFGIAGPPPGRELFPGYALGAFLQFASDVMSSVRWLREGDVGPLRAADPALASLAFDPEHVFYLGISMGSVVGASVLAAEPDVKAYVLVVAPGSIVETLCEGGEFRGLTMSLLAPLLGVDGRFDEVARSCVMDPIVDLFEFALEPIDPLALAPAYLREPFAPGPRPDVLWLVAANDEVAAPTATESVLSAAGVEGMGAFELAPVAAATLPVTANFATPTGDVTALAMRLSPATHGMPEVLHSQSRYELPLLPPLRPRAMPIDVENPIVMIHAQVESLLRARLAGPHVTLP